MVELDYVKKKKRKRRAAIGAGISFSIATALIIVAFLGNRVGTFSVRLKRNNVDLTLAPKGNSESSQQGTNLYVDALSSFYIVTNNTLQSHALYDDENHDFKDFGLTDPDNPGSSVYLPFFKYTFYVNNVGLVYADYVFSLRITENIKPSNVTYGFDDILRVRIYENDTVDTHNFTTYAKAMRYPTQVDDDGKLIYNTPVSIKDPERPDYAGLADLFYNDYTPDSDSIVSRRVSKFAPGAQKRYTVMFWLEGEDPDCEGKPPRDDGSIRLEVNIDAYESQQQEEE